MNNDQVGKNISKLRKEKGWSQQQLGDKVGTSKSTISNWEMGEGAPIKKLDKLATALNVSKERLLGMETTVNKQTSPINQGRNRNYHSQTYQKLSYRSFNYFDIFLLTAISLTYLSALILNDAVQGFMIIMWIIVLIMIIIETLSKRSAQKKTIYYQDNQKVVYDLNENALTYETLKKQLSEVQKYIGFSSIAIFLLSIIGFGIVNSLSNNDYSLIIGLAAFVLLIIYMIFIIFEYKTVNALGTIIDIQKIHSRFGIWRYQLLFVTHVIIYLILYLLLNVEDITLLELDTAAFIFFTLIPLMVIMTRYYLTSYNNVFSNYTVTVIDKQ